jgi:hypothetical protein
MGQLAVAGIVVVVALLGLGAWWWTKTGEPRIEFKGTLPDDRYAQAGKDVAGEGSVNRIVYLKQNWTAAESVQFYFTSQGSQILPYDWFLVLESANDETLLRDDRNMLKFGYLLQKKDDWNPDALPVGFVKDDVSPRAWLGLTCAACHTGQINYQGVGYRIDGGPSLSDVRGFLSAVVDALKATRDQKPKFDRFAEKILKGKDTAAARDELKEMLTATIDRREGYNKRNFPKDATAGNGRVDAFGAIVNEVFHEAAIIPDGTSDPATVGAEPATAPVSYPCLWDTPQHDLVQWNGAVKNEGLGALGRNVGEVLGVFGRLEIPKQPSRTGYRSSVQVRQLMTLEGLVTTLWSPQWPEGLPPIKEELRKRGEEVYTEAKCADCHEAIVRTDPNRKVKAKMVAVGADASLSINFARRLTSTGKLNGAYKQVVGPPITSGDKLGPEGGAEEVLSHAVIGTIIGSGYRAPEDELTKIEYKRRTANVGGQFAPPRAAIYKGRPLNGIWATAPYLHNGSVPTLADMLKPAKDRTKTFAIGSREFDPKNVGIRTDVGQPNFRARNEDGSEVPGNSNSGHEGKAFGTDLSDSDKLALLEYLKSL